VSACLRSIGVTLLAFIVIACATTVNEESKPEEPLSPVSDKEADLWLAMDRAERDLVLSGQLVDDPALQQYVRRVGCRIAPDYCDGIRIYVVEQPDFNASMAPNGAMTVWSGLLLRCENEAQLATVLGHEIAHYQRRHSLQMWHNRHMANNIIQVPSRTMSVLLNMLSIIHAPYSPHDATWKAGIRDALRIHRTGAAVTGGVETLRTLGQLSLFPLFERNQEREADRIGFERMVSAYYDPTEAAKIWEGLLVEKEAVGSKDPLIFFATHPPSEERFQTLRMMADDGKFAGNERGTERFVKVTAPHRGKWLEAEFKRGHYARVQVLLNRLIVRGEKPAELYYYQGELYRRRGEKGDAERAVHAYEKALNYNETPVEAYRNLALVQWTLDHTAEARSAFQRYLALAPEAVDRTMVQSYIEQLQ
jgi:beta-barrel assembly-enhancing protease